MLHVQTSLFWWLDNCVDAVIFPSTQFWHGKLQEENMMPWYAMLTASHTSIRKSGSENLVATTFFPATKSERLQRSLWIYPVDVGSWAAGVTWIGADVLRWFLLGLESLESLELGFCGLGQSWLDLFVDVLRWRYVYMYNLTDVHYMYICAYIAVCEVLFLASNCLAWLVLPPWMWHCQKQQLTAIPELVCWLAWQQQITWSWTSCDVYIQFILVW